MLKFIKKEPVLCVATLAALVSMFFVKPGKQYLGYIDLPVIILLFCLMFVVSGMMKANLFNVISSKMLKATSDSRKIAIILVNITYLSAMFITNDVALITLVPLTVGIFKGKDSKNLILLVALETVAANLGSMIMPFGNPQNLYLYSYYEMNALKFITTVLPLGVVSLVLINITVIILIKKEELLSQTTDEKIKDKSKFIVYIILFVICVLTVFKIINTYVCLVVVVIIGLIADRKIFLKVDYNLLLTFCAFFVFVGNLGNIAVVKDFVAKMLENREFIVGVLASQIISNVPAAIMLSGFTESAQALLLGVNIGGLGTLVASLASLISYKQYSLAEGADMKKYLFVFTVINVAFLALICPLYFVLY